MLDLSSIIMYCSYSGRSIVCVGASDSLRFVTVVDSLSESSQSQSHIVTDGQSVSLGVEPPAEAQDQIFIAV
jgi:hypothetical protein